MTDADRLLDLLDRLEPAGDFCTWGALPMMLPGLEVEGVGPVPLPIQPAQARELVRVAAQAPYGRGQETVVDTQVRRVWQLEPGQFELRNPAWAETVDAAVQAVQGAFAIPGKIEAHLYKLLVYEKGSFFVAHRDTEKLDRMFATLVVCLPSQHTGGALEVTHDGETWSMDLSPDSAYGLQYAAFYADCLHEVKPVQSGYRVCLVYNLVKPRGRLQAPRPSAHVQPVADALAAVLRHRVKVAIPLGHEYTEAGLRWDDLKGRDRVLLQVLQAAAERLGLDLHLALMTLYQRGEADLEDFYRYSRRRMSEEDVGVSEIYEERFALDAWRNAEGPVDRLGTLQLDPDEVLLRGGLEDLPWEQEVHEATGNEGVSVERTYRGAMAVLWPRNRFLTLLARQGPVVAVPMLAEQSGQAALDFAAAIMDAWPPGRSPACAGMLDALARLGDADLASRFVRDVLPQAMTGSEGEALAKLVRSVGPKAMTPALAEFAGGARALEPAVQVLSSLGQLPLAVGRELLGLLKRCDSQRPTWDRPDRRPTLEAILRAVHDWGELEEELAAYCLQDEVLYPVREVLAPVVAATAKLGGEAWRRLHARCLERLREWTATPVVIPDHWAQAVTLGCRCEPCQDVERFMADPAATVWRLKAVQYRRDHVQERCRTYRLDVDARTERAGSPHTLVLTKNRASYERAQRQFQADLGMLAQVERLGG